jgi:NADH-quinone oxidoreductase subunit N
MLDVFGQSTGVLPADDAVALGPLIALVVTAMVLFIADMIDPETQNVRAVAGISIGGTLLALLISLAHLFGITDVLDTTTEPFQQQLVVDELSLFFTVIVTTVTTLVLTASMAYFDRAHDAGSFYSLVVLAATGMVSMAHANSLVTVFLALELASLPSYALVAFLKRDRNSVEAGLKYFLIGALSSAVFLYGISLVYGVTGTLQLDSIATALRTADAVDGEYAFSGLLGIGLIMLIGGFAFKTASVPFHFWAPEAYEGSPTPVSALLSSASKAAGFVIAFRVLVVAFPYPIRTTLPMVSVDWSLLLVALALTTMIVGNFAAALQTRVKRMLAYSSVGHAGYVLIALAALSNGGELNEWLLAAGMIHLLVYGIMNTGAFLFVALAETWDVGRRFEDYNGLGTEAPVAAAAMTILLVNLAGIPIGGGFWGKYWLFTGAVGAEEYLLAGVLVVTSALSLFYYARLIKAMWIESPRESFDIEERPAALYGPIVACAAITVLLLGAIFLFDGPAAEAAGQLLQS